jgi:hypothetical protein
MARTGLTNFVVWALATWVFGFFFIAPDSTAFLLAAGALAVAWWTRFWPEALGLAAGVAAVLLTYSLYDPTGLLPAAAVAAATFFVWRRLTGAAGRPAPSRPKNGTATPMRLIVATLVAAVTVFVLDFLLALSFGFTCQSDTSHATPGSDRAAWCDTLGRDDVTGVVLLGPALLVGVAGLYLAWRGRAREVMMIVVAGFALTIAFHIPDLVLSNAAP